MRVKFYIYQHTESFQKALERLSRKRSTSGTRQGNRQKLLDATWVEGRSCESRCCSCSVGDRRSAPDCAACHVVWNALARTCSVCRTSGSFRRSGSTCWATLSRASLGG